MTKECIILWRPDIDSKLYILMENEHQIKIFPNREEAKKFIESIGWAEAMCQIVELQI